LRFLPLDYTGFLMKMEAYVRIFILVLRLCIFGLFLGNACFRRLTGNKIYAEAVEEKEKPW
jgi:hypothetical protein